MTWIEEKMFGEGQRTRAEGVYIRSIDDKWELGTPNNRHAGAGPAGRT